MNRPKIHFFAMTSIKSLFEQSLIKNTTLHIRYLKVTSKLFLEMNPT
jgi:hypothetical protein